MNPIRTNKPTFFGNDGDVLKSGEIFIGQPNQWPIDFPKTVTFQDSAGTQFTAQQPLTTNSQGQISYNGKAIIALVDGNYSMLVRDRNGVVVNDGYTPFIENTDAGGGPVSGGVQVGLTLLDIQAIDATAGDVLRNIGKVTAEDGLGEDWLVVANTGNPANDFDLTNLDNGLQAKRIVTSPVLVWSGSQVGVPMSALDGQGDGLYLVALEAGSDIRFSIYVEESYVSGQYGTSQIVASSGSINTVSAFFSGGNFQVWLDTFDGTTSTRTQQAIGAIYRVY